jgi:hypothetical protein
MNSQYKAPENGSIFFDRWTGIIIDLKIAMFFFELNVCKKKYYIVTLIMRKAEKNDRVR